MPSNCMIPATPDISGLGVRLSIYSQSLLCFIPPVLFVLGRWSIRGALDLSERLIVTNLILAFAILGSSVAQALNNGLANYHAHIALKLSWLGVCNVVTFYWMYGKFKAGETSECKHLRRPHAVLEAGPSPESSEGEAKSTLLKPIVILSGGAFMVIVGFFGIWLWKEPGYFGPTNTLCVTDLAVVRMPLLWNLRTLMGSSSLRACYLVIYGVFLAVVAPLLVVRALSPRCHGAPSSKIARRTVSKFPKTLICLVILSVATIFEIEATLRENQHLQASDRSSLDFGQVLAVVLVMVPVRDILRFIAANGTQQAAANDFRLPRDSSDLKNALGEKDAGNTARIG